MNGKQKVLVVYVFLHFFCNYPSDAVLENRIQGYIDLVSQGVGIQPGKNSSCARAVALIKITLGRMEGSSFLPDEEAVLYLLKKSYLNPNIKDPHTGATFLHFAAFYGACNVMRFLLHKARVRIDVDGEGKNPLHWACNPYHKVPRKEVVELLVKAKKDLIHARDLTHKTPFFYLPSHSEVADFLLGVGININEQDELGNTTLFRFKDEESMRYLCSHGAHVNHQNHQMVTVLGICLTDYSSRCDLVKNNPKILGVNELRRGIKTLLKYGCYVPRMHHPAYRMAPLESNFQQNEKMKRVKVLEHSFGDILQDMEKELDWIKMRAVMSKKSKTMQGVSPILVFDRCVSALPFFETRFKEMNEIFEKEKEAGYSSDESPLGDIAAFEKFLCRLSFSKNISPELFFIACELVFNKKEYVEARLLPEEKRSEMGKKIVEKIFP